MWRINLLGKAICKLVAGKNVSAQKSLLHELVYNALDSLDDGLDYLRFVEMYPQYISALSGDDPELACEYLNEMVYRCSDAEDTGYLFEYLFDMMAKSKHGDHYYAEYC
jgi:hypothetical protein